MSDDEDDDDAPVAAKAEAAAARSRPHLPRTAALNAQTLSQQLAGLKGARPGTPRGVRVAAA